MPRKKQGARVLGPFVSGERWRVVSIDAAGRRTAHTFDDAQTARRHLAKLVKQLDERMVESTIGDWTDARLRAGKVLEKTIAHQAERARGLLGELLPMQLDAVTERRALAQYEAHRTTPSRRTGKLLQASSHRFDLAVARALWSWAVKQGFVKANPWLTVEPAGRVSTGKPQLRPSEALAFSAAAEGAARDGDSVALMALLCLSLGLRSGEALAIVPRDIDSGHLFVAGSKTPAARRRLKLSGLLQELLRQACRGRERTELICSASRQALHREVRRLCKKAHVPLVCTHALRGSHASLAVESGDASVDAVARALGHSSTRITRKHYVSDEAADGARIDAFERSLNVPESFPQH